SIGRTAWRSGSVWLAGYLLPLTFFWPAMFTGTQHGAVCRRFPGQRSRCWSRTALASCSTSCCANRFFSRVPVADAELQRMLHSAPAVATERLILYEPDHYVDHGIAAQHPIDDVSSGQRHFVQDVPARSLKSGCGVHLGGRALWNLAT